MMGRALLIIGALATLGFVASAVLGYGLTGPTDPELPPHLLVGLGAVLMMLFSHSWILIYLLGTGRAVGEAVRTFQLEADLAEASRRFRRRAIPVLLVAVGLVFATFLLGAAVVPKVVPSWIHHALFYVTVIAQVIALRIESQMLRANEELLVAIDRRVSTLPPVQHAANSV